MENLEMKNANLVLESLEDYAGDCYGEVDRYVYDGLINAINDIRDYTSGYIQDFNEMGTDARVYFTDAFDALGLSDEDEDEEN